MTTAVTEQVDKPLAIGEYRDFPVSGTGYTVCVVRTADVAYQVFVAARDEHGIPVRVDSHTRDFAAIELGLGYRDAADAYRLHLLAALGAPRLAPAAKGTTLKVTDPQHAALATAATVGQVLRGRFEDGRAPIRTLNALARRRFIDLTYRHEGRRRIVTGATITALGLRRLAELDATAAHTPMTIAA